MNHNISPSAALAPRWGLHSLPRPFAGTSLYTLDQVLSLAQPRQYHRLMHLDLLTYAEVHR